MKFISKISLFFTLFLVLAMVALAASASTRLTTASTTVRKGATTDISVRIDASDRIRGGQFNLGLNNNNFEIVSVSGASGFSISSSGNFHLLYKIESGFSVASGSSIATIRVRPKSTATVGSRTTLTVSNVQVTLVDSYDTVSAGSKSITLTVGETPTVEPTTPLSDNNFLKSLTSEVVDLEFDKDVLEYDVTVLKSVTSLNVQAEAEDEKAKIVITGDEDFVIGSNVVKVVVTAENGTKRTYTINVERDMSNNNKLKMLEIADFEIEFDPETYNYQINSENIYLESLDITYETEDEAATVVIVGNQDFELGKNNVTILVTAENGDIQAYNITVNIIDAELISRTGNLNMTITIIAIILAFAVIGQIYYIYNWRKNREQN